MNIHENGARILWVWVERDRWETRWGKEARLGQLVPGVLHPWGGVWNGGRKRQREVDELLFHMFSLDHCREDCPGVSGWKASGNVVLELRRDAVSGDVEEIQNLRNRWAGARRSSKMSPDWFGSVGWAFLLQSKRLPVQFLVRAHAYVAGSVPGQGTCERQPIDVSLPLFLPSPFSKNNK